MGLLLANEAGVERFSPGLGVVKPGIVLANSSNTAVWFGVTPPTYKEGEQLLQDVENVFNENWVFNTCLN